MMDNQMQIQIGIAGTIAVFLTLFVVMSKVSGIRTALACFATTALGTGWMVLVAYFCLIESSWPDKEEPPIVRFHNLAKEEEVTRQQDIHHLHQETIEELERESE